MSPIIRRESTMALCVAAALIAALDGCPTPPVQPVEPANVLPIAIGMEYAFPGLAADFAQLRAPAVKFMPDLIGWGEMQSSATASINFSTLDRLVREYQQAGFRECMIGLKSESAWASVQPFPLEPSPNLAPKPEYMDDYEAWVGAVVERYDGDGIDDFADLEHPLRYYEIGVEFSSFEPEPVEDYVAMLEVAYRAAHNACSDVIVMHAAILAANAFIGDPGPGEYEASFAAVDERIMFHSLDDIRAILDRPDLFDAVNFHALSYPDEIEATVEWLNYEMAQRGYTKPLVISDTGATSFIGWGPATFCDGTPDQMGLMLPPATEADRCRLAAYFQQLVAGDQATTAWVRGFCAEEMIKGVIVAAQQGVIFFNTAFMEDLTPMQIPLFRASAGNAPWGGMVEGVIHWFRQEHSVRTFYPLYYALQQLVDHLDGCDTVERVATESTVRLYALSNSADASAVVEWIAWYAPTELFLPEDPRPETEFSFNETDADIAIEALITGVGQTEPDTVTSAGPAPHVLTLTPTPVFIMPSTAR